MVLEASLGWQCLCWGRCGRTWHFFLWSRLRAPFLFPFSWLRSYFMVATRGGEYRPTGHCSSYSGDFSSFPWSLLNYNFCPINLSLLPFSSLLSCKYYKVFCSFLTLVAFISPWFHPLLLPIPFFLPHILPRPLPTSEMSELTKMSVCLPPSISGV